MGEASTTTVSEVVPIKSEAADDPEVPPPADNEPDNQAPNATQLVVDVPAAPEPTPEAAPTTEAITAEPANDNTPTEQLPATGTD